MIVTEKEAKKICCFKCFPNDGLCMASQCMAWRWHDSKTESLHQAKKPDGEDWEEVIYSNGFYWSRPRADRRRGYCGLAYPPEEI